MEFDISNSVRHYIETTPSLDDWPDCRELLIKQLVNDKPWIHALPVLACQSVGGETRNALPVASAWITLVHASNVIDNIQDGDFSSLDGFGNPADALTIAIAWIFCAFRMLDDPLISQEARQRVYTLLTIAGFNSALGQYQDLVLTGKLMKGIDQLQDYWRMMILKSGNIMMAGAAGGAAVGTNLTSWINALGDYGTALGVIRQVMDDCKDFWSDSIQSTRRYTLPLILFSMVSGKPADNIEPRKDLSDSIYSKMQIEGSTRLMKAGIPEIIADILLEWRRRALMSLQVLQLSEARSALEDILENAMTINHKTG